MNNIKLLMEVKSFSKKFKGDKKKRQKFGGSEKSSTFASVFAYIWANGGCREIVPHLFFFIG